MKPQYDHKEIETKWRKMWEEKELFQGQYFKEDKNEVSSKNKLYILPQLPYPSGAGLHMGHAEVYTACDIYARYQRMKGKKVLQVIGWDAFGLPAENYAIKTNIHPRINTDKAIDNFREQIKSLGVSVDWKREVGSHNPDYYKFTQWFFLLMYKRGLAYRKKQSVNWCEGCKTVLANEQVVEGKCERCSTEVIQKEMEQWFFKITDYAERLIEGLNRVDWPEESVKRQKDWIGKSTGARIFFPLENNNGDPIEVFTTRPDTVFGATYIVISPENPLVEKLTDKSHLEEVREYVLKSAKKTEIQRSFLDKEKTGVYTGGYAINPANNAKIPVLVADYVLMTYGTGAVMGVPAHDQRDYDFVKKYGLKITPVLESLNGEHPKLPYTGEGKVVNSEELNGLLIPKEMDKVTDWLEKKNIGKKAVTYKLRDWSVSRQRFWGAPIPMVYDPEGNIHPVDEKDLPVILPDDVDFVPTGRSPLTYSESFQKGVEDKYGKGWKREVDTLDTFLCSSWYYFRYIDPKNENEFASKENIKRWMPVDFYIGGPEHVNGHLLYSRFFTKVLFDAGYIDFDEPFMFHRHQGLIMGEDNRKMSKRWGNVINPSDVVEKYGADTARTYEMFMGPLSSDKAWNTKSIMGVRKYISRVNKIVIKNLNSLPQATSRELLVELNRLIEKVGSDISKLKFNTAIAKMMEFVNSWERDKQGLSPEDIEKFIKILSPFAPFLSEELYQKVLAVKAGNEVLNENSRAINQEFISVHVQSWPEYNEVLAKDESITVIVQVNGKLRGTLTDVSQNEFETDVTKKAEILAEKYLTGKKILKTIYVKNKLINFVVS